MSQNTPRKVLSLSSKVDMGLLYLPGWSLRARFFRKFVRSKHEPVCEEVWIYDAAPRSSLLLLPDGSETTVSRSDLVLAGYADSKPPQNRFHIVFNTQGFTFVQGGLTF